MYLPAVGASPSPARKGLAGSASVAQRRDIGANWYHHWGLCNESEGIQCVDVSKGHWTWDDPPDGYGQGPDEIAAALERCASGWFLFGDEWQYQDSQGYPYPMSKQVAEARWYVEMRDEVNPDCKLAFGGILTFHPSYPGMFIARDWVPAFYDAYMDAYGEAPDIDALVFDDYYWKYWYYSVGLAPDDWETVTAMSIAAVRDTYGPNVEIWAREIGSLMSHDKALESMDRLGDITKYYDRYAWFITQSSGDWDYTALWVDGELTDLGERYKEFEKPSPWGP